MNAQTRTAYYTSENENERRGVNGWVVAPPDGLEPSTFGLTASANEAVSLIVRCSTELSSRPHILLVNGGSAGISHGGTVKF